MGSKTLVICDQEEGYRAALSAYITERKELALQVFTCNSIQGMQRIQKEMKVDYLFISATYEAEERKKLTAKRVFVLTGVDQCDLLKGERAIYKYQSGDAILAELIKRCSEEDEDTELLMKAGKREQVTIIGVFSPLHRVGKTTYALELGKKLALKGSTLYLNMELYGGIGGLFPEEPKQTLSDVLYYSRQESRNLSLFLTTMAEQMGELDYVAPAAVSEDIRTVTVKEWTSLIGQIAAVSFYETIILDLDEGMQGIYELLKLCTQVHMPVANYPAANAKVRQFEQELEFLGLEEILQKLVRKEQRL